MLRSRNSAEYEIISNSKYFDKNWYLKRYVDVANSGMDPVRHYLEYGWKEGRNPGPDFDTRGYLKRYSDCNINPLLHFETVGKSKEYETGPYVSVEDNKRYWKERKKLGKTKKVIYSCVTGGYDEIVTDFYPNSDYDYILFTDNEKLLKQKKILWWTVRPLAFSDADSIRNARWHKTHPHVLFPEYDYSVWMDSNIQISGPEIYNLIEKHIRQRHKIAIALHPERNCIYDEAIACISDSKDEPEVIMKQMDLLKKEKYPRHNGLYETNVLYRRHNDKQIIRLCEKWWDIIKNYSRRDQLSFNYLLWKLGVKHYAIDTEPLRKHPEFRLIVHNYKPAVKRELHNKILVHIHLFYHDQLDWFISRLKNITCDYDLWLTVTENNKETEDKIKNFKPDAHILKVPNRGYDLYPFWLVLQKVSLFDYDAVLKLHTKNKRTKKWCKNGVCYNGFEWRDDLINPLLGNKRLFQKAVDLVKCDNIGMVGSANLIGNKENPEQAKNTKILCELMGIKYSHDGKFVCGTMFLIKASLLLVFQQYPFKKSDFSSESKTGSTGTVAHSLETVMGLIVADRKLKLVGVDTLGTSFKHFCAKYKQKYINLLKAIRKRKKEVDYIKHSKYFNKRWYLRTYPDVARAKVNPAHHYLLHGWKEGRRPGPKFDPKFYLENNLDVKRAKVNPLLHYEKHGKYEGRTICLKRSFKPSVLKEFHDVYVNAFRWRGNIAKRVVVSLTTYPGRIKSVHETINTLKNQSIKPDKVILYLSEQEFPKKDKGLPRNLTRLCDDCFEIHWIKKTLYSFQKLIPALKEYPSAVIVTADDDILYKNNWLELLVKAYLENPKLIHCHRAHRIKYHCGNIISYNLWKMAIRNESALYNNFLTGVGGVLYPPHCLDKNVTNSKEFLKLCPKADDIWIWAMAVKNHTKIHVVKGNITALELVPGSQDGDCLCKINTGAECYNDVQLKNVFAKYPEILEMLRHERRNNAILSHLLYPYYLLYFLRNSKK